MISRLRKKCRVVFRIPGIPDKIPCIREEFSEKAETRVLGSLKSLGGEDWDVYHR